MEARKSTLQVLLLAVLPFFFVSLSPVRIEVCTINNVRLGGQPGDQYIGPTCDNDGTYRSCFYISGPDLPTNAAAYTVTIEGVPYTVAFLQVIGPQEVVVCVLGVPGDGTQNVDVTVDAGGGCTYTAVDLIDEPKCTCDITDVRVGGQPGDQYIGPTCDNNGTYRTCLYITGSFLPTNAAAYTVTIDGVTYTPAFLQVISGQQVVVCVLGIPGDATAAVDVTVDAGTGCSYTATALFDEPKCTCDITDVRVGGQPGDQYIGPTCDNNGTYRTCFYITGSFLPTNAAAYTVTIDGVTYTPAFLQVLSGQQVVVCVLGVPGDASTDVDVTIDAGNGCAYTATDLFDEPKCTCEITDVRVAGQPGDQFIGPTCDNNGTYRTCFYITGSFLPTNAAAYTVTVDGVTYTPAFLQVLSGQQVVVCILGVPGDASTDVDVTIDAGNGCAYTATDLFDEPKCTCEITDVRVAGQPGDQFIGPTCDNNGTYRTCFYITGSFLPTNAAAYTVTIDGVTYTPAFLQVLSGQQVVVCVLGVPGDASTDVDVTIDAGNGCTYTATDLFDEPKCTCEITGLRVGGQPGDQYVGPTCDNNGTYRTCFYVTGNYLPTNAAAYEIVIDGVSYPVAFTKAISTQEVVICVTGIPANGTKGVPVYVRLSGDPECEIRVCPLYDEPLSCPGGNYPPDPIAGPWSAKAIGGAGGGVTFDACDPDQFTITATGASKKNRDEQQLVYQEICGNAEIIARVRSQSGIGWVGLEMRQNLSDNSPMVLLMRKRNPIVRGEYRLSSGGKTEFTQDNRRHDSWLRLVRIGNTFTGYTSPDGKTWKLLFTQTVVMTNCIKVGLFVESLNDKQVTVGVFDEVTISNSPSTPLAAPAAPVAVLPASPVAASLDFDLYPNPAHDRVTVGLAAFAGQPVVVELRSLTGAVMLRRSLSADDSPTATLEVDRLPPGAYLVSVSSPTGRAVKKLVVGGE
ncbi:T9SS type A sorting domain-containing protein [Neolewinella litorea]|uniref:T9SS type A sorting domain-containing protein n=1 Tax=Neolewinella litorea TaxID=2562452 RepID=A0A4S4N8D1_9BACT|nr:T9SS type A sorting domain-containing protein [Neolewinella litorea]THH34597.1 T9SS type A sorting domain-containing protein [Neolewinella litorea]